MMKLGQQTLQQNSGMNTGHSIHNISRTAGILGLLLIIYAAAVTWYSWIDEKAESVRNMTTIAELEAMAIDSYFTHLEIDLKSLGEDLKQTGTRVDLDQAYALVKRFKEMHKELFNVTLIQLDGEVLLTAKTPPGTTHATLAKESSFIKFVEELNQGRILGIGQPLVGVVSKVVIVPVRYAVKDHQGHLIYIVSANLPHEHLRSFWMDATITAKASIGLMRDNGFLLSHYPTPANLTLEEIYGRPRAGALINHLQQKGFPERGHVQGPSSLDGPDFLNAFRRLPNFPVTLFIATPMSEIRASWWKKVSGTYLAMIFLFISGFATYRYALRRQYADNMAQKRLEEAQRDSELRFRAIMEASPVPSAVNDTHLNVTYLNAAFTDTFGYNQSDILTVQEWWPKAYPDPNYRQRVAATWQARLEASLRDNVPFEPMEVQVTAKNGDVRTALAMGTPLGSSHDGLTLVTLYDISRQKNIENAFRDSEEQMAMSQQIGGTGSWSYDVKTNGLHASAQSLAIFGFPSVAKDYPLDDFLACIPERDRVGLTLGSAISAGRTYEDEYAISPADGSPSKTIHSIGKLETDAQGSPLRVVGFIQDITERRRQESLIKDHNALLTRQKAELEDTLRRVKRLEGMLTICMQCKKILTENSDWHQLERYIGEHSDAVFSHGICPECMAKSIAEPSAAAVDGMGRRILYVDDEEGLVLLMKLLLTHKGFRFSGYTDPREALAAVRAYPDQFDLVVTDYKMPHLSGLEVARALKEIRADLPVVLASGFITEEVRDKAPAAGIRELIEKPSTTEKLAEAIMHCASALCGEEIIS
jgi:PAS domain S-box-containing protein